MIIIEERYKSGYVSEWTAAFCERHIHHAKNICFGKTRARNSVGETRSEFSHNLYLHIIRGHNEYTTSISLVADETYCDGRVFGEFVMTLDGDGFFADKWGNKIELR